MQQTIIGKVQSIVYHNESNLFTVMRFVLYEINEKQIFVRGFTPEIEKGAMLECVGLYQEHPKYGMQFVADSIQRIIPQEKDSLTNFLSSPAFNGIGKKTAELFVEALGVNCLEQVKADPTKRYDIEGLAKKKQEIIIEGILKTDHEDQLISLLTTKGLSMRQLMKIQKVYGEDTLWLIKNNPYRLVDDIDGIGFKTADQVAMALGFEESDPLRQEAAMIDACMNQCMRNGDSYVEESLFLTRFSKEFPMWESAMDILERVLAKRKLVLEENRLYPLSQYEAEVYVADYFKNSTPKVEVVIEDLEEQIKNIERTFSIEYDEQQTKALLHFFKSDSMIITGGPGTGKTTLVLALIALCKMAEPPIVIESCAPTGRAAKRLSTLSNFKANTIHSLLQWDLESNTFGRNAENPLVVDVLIVDEFSMVDTYLFSKLLMALPSHTRILLIGDHNQLPSVAPGNVLQDLIASEVCPVVLLDTIYRQQAGSEVIALAHQVLAGDFTINFTQDVRLHACDNTQAKDRAINLVQKALDKGYAIEDIQVLAPKYNGIAGIDAMNHSLQKAFNPPDFSKRELQVGYRTYREFDKILQLKNQVDDQVFNGDIGRLVEIIYAKEDPSKQNRFIIDFDGNFVEYTSDMFINISHAYCLSVHKSQGSEYPIVILLAFLEYGWMLQRRLYYTGITRASNYLICLGEEEAFFKAVSHSRIIPKKTYLKQRILG
jgi:exodeoxyribonuclease V alpha subunit